MYVSESEGANFWLSVLTDLKARGMKDVLIACIDNLTDFAEAIIQNSVIQEMDATAPELGVTTGQLRIKFGEKMPLAR